jgi:hypothetical protein
VGAIRCTGELRETASSGSAAPGQTRRVQAIPRGTTTGRAIDVKRHDAHAVLARVPPRGGIPEPGFSVANRPCRSVRFRACRCCEASARRAERIPGPRRARWQVEVAGRSSHDRRAEPGSDCRRATRVRCDREHECSRGRTGSGRRAAVRWPILAWLPSAECSRRIGTSVRMWPSSGQYGRRTSALASILLRRTHYCVG